MEKGAGEFLECLPVLAEQHFVFEWVKCLWESESLHPLPPPQER